MVRDPFCATLLPRANTTPKGMEMDIANLRFACVAAFVFGSPTIITRVAYPELFDLERQYPASILIVTRIQRISNMNNLHAKVTCQTLYHLLK
jgi:hypothetical protein